MIAVTEGVLVFYFELQALIHRACVAAQAARINAAPTDVEIVRIIVDALRYLSLACFCFLGCSPSI